MADIDGFGIVGPVENIWSGTKNRTIGGFGVERSVVVDSTNTFYLMAAIDDNADGSPGQERPFYRTWKVQDEPDPTAALYTGSFFGASINFINIYVQATWIE